MKKRKSPGFTLSEPLVGISIIAKEITKAKKGVAIISKFFGLNSAEATVCRWLINDLNTLRKMVSNPNDEEGLSLTIQLMNLEKRALLSMLKNALKKRMDRK